MSVGTETIHGNALAVTDDGRDAWLAERQKSIGSSEAAAVLGVSPYDAPIDIWQRKLNIVGEKECSEQMLWGNLLEPVIAAEYQRRTGMAFTGTQLFFRHPERPWMTATLDGLRADGRIAELKTAGAWAREWGDEDSDEVPEPYLVQVHHQMAVTGAEVADIAVLIGGQRFQIYTVERNEDLIGLILETEERFWQCVERRIPPTWGKLDARALAAVYPECSGSVDLDASTSALVAEYETAKKAEKENEEKVETLKSGILAALGTNQFGKLPDGRLVKRFREEVAAKTVSYAAKAYTKHYLKVLKGDSK